MPSLSPARLLLGALLAPFLVATVAGLVVLWPEDATPPIPDVIGPPANLADATVSRVERRPCAGTEPSQGVTCQDVTIRLTSGSEAGTTAGLEVSEGQGAPRLERRDKIVVGRVEEATGQPGGSWYFYDYQRRTPLLVLGLCFALAVVGLARWRGLLAMAGLAVSLVVLVRFVLPAILGGSSPVWVAVVGSAAIMFFTLYLAHGVNVRITTAVLGTLASLLLTGLLAYAFVEASRLTGLASEEAGFLSVAVEQVNLRGLLLGGIVIGSLGVLAT